MITALFFTAAYDAVTFAEIFQSMDFVDTVKVADVAPAGTVIFAGTDTAFRFELVNEMLAPPAGAGADSVIVAVADVPPTTVDGAMAIPTSAAGPGGGGDGGVTVKVVVCATPA